MSDKSGERSDDVYDLSDEFVPAVSRGNQSSVIAYAIGSFAGSVYGSVVYFYVVIQRFEQTFRFNDFCFNRSIVYNFADSSDFAFQSSDSSIGSVEVSSLFG